MFDFLKSIVWSLFRRVVVGSSTEADNLALHHQVAVLQRRIRHRPQLTRWDRLLFAALYRFQPSVLRSISIVQPETVVRWHRAGFRLFWKFKSRAKAGRPRVPGKVKALIREISNANPRWGAPRGSMVNCSRLELTSRSRRLRPTWSEEDTLLHRDGSPFCAIMPMASPQWTCLSSRPLASGFCLVLLF